MTTQTFLDAAAAAGIPDLGTWSNLYGEEYVADYDNGRNRRNTLNRIPGLSSNAGVGQPDEAIITGGDSGGGDFVWNGREWLLTGVHSWGWQFCDGRIDPSCDRSTRNSGSYGDLMASTAVYAQADWIDSVTRPTILSTPIPEPSTYGLMALGLFAVGAAARRQSGRSASFS